MPHSYQYSNTLMHFSDTPDRLLDALRNGGFTLNYVKEEFVFLRVEGIKSIAFPMICFCDILPDPKRLEPHMAHYGRFALGLSKEWGRTAGAQPVHYVVEGSPYYSDLQCALRTAMGLKYDKLDADTTALSDFLITQLAYTKPLWGLNNNKSYCFQDECEWRLLPSSLPENMPSYIPSPTKDALGNFQKTLWRPDTFLLRFKPTDIRQIYVKDKRSIQSFEIVIDELQINVHEKETLKALIEVI